MSNKVPKSAILKNRSLDYEVELKDIKNLPYPLVSIKECHYLAKVYKLASYNHASYEIKATLELEDVRDAVHFIKDIHLKEEVDLMDEEDDIGEGYIVSGNSVDLDDICIRIIISSLPIRVVRKGKAKDLSSLGVILASNEESKASPFDVLADLDL